MVRKSLFAVGGVMLLLSLLFGRSYVTTAWDETKSFVNESEPIDFQIKRARTMIKELDPEIRKNMHVIAKQEVEVQKLSKQLDDVNASLADSRSDIKRLTHDLERGDSNYVYAGKSYTVQQVTTDLERRFDRYTTKEATADKLAKILQARLTALDAAREKLQEMQGAKRQLEVEVANLEARLELVEVASVASDINFDDSHLARTRELVENINTRVAVAENLVNSDVTFADEINLDEPETRDILNEVAKHFGEATPEKTEVASIVLD